MDWRSASQPRNAAEEAALADFRRRLKSSNKPSPTPSGASKPEEGAVAPAAPAPPAHFAAPTPPPAQDKECCVCLDAAPVAVSIHAGGAHVRACLRPCLCLLAFKPAHHLPGRHTTHATPRRPSPPPPALQIAVPCGHQSLCVDCATGGAAGGSTLVLSPPLHARVSRPVRNPWPQRVDRPPRPPPAGYVNTHTECPACALPMEGVFAPGRGMIKRNAWAQRRA